MKNNKFPQKGFNKIIWFKENEEILVEKWKLDYSQLTSFTQFTKLSLTYALNNLEMKNARIVTDEQGKLEIMSQESK